MGKPGRVLILILISVMLSATGQLSMKSGVNSLENFGVSDIIVPAAMFKVISTPMIALGVFLYGIASVFWLATLSRAELSYAYPMIAISYVVTSVIAWLLFKENLTLIRFLGISMIIGGVYVISLKR